MKIKIHKRPQLNNLPLCRFCKLEPELHYSKSGFWLACPNKCYTTGKKPSLFGCKYDSFDLKELGIINEWRIQHGEWNFDLPPRANDISFLIEEQK